MELIDLVIVWVVVYLIAVGVFAVVRRYLAKVNDESPEPTGGPVVEGASNHPRPNRESAANNSEICTTCGSENDPFFTYCRNCLTSLETDASSAISY